MGRILTRSVNLQQPQSAALIDSSNPLARGIVNAWVNGRDVAQNATAFLPLAATASGMAGTLSGSNFASLGTAIGQTGPCSYLVITTVTGDNGTGWADILSMGDRCTLRYLNDGHSDEIEFYTFDGSNWETCVSSSSYLLPFSVTVAAVHTGAANLLYILQGDSLEIDSVTASPRNTGAHQLRIGLDDETSRSMTGTVTLALTWNRALSANEAATLTANPWQVFLPPARRIWVAASSGGNVSENLTAQIATFTEGALGVSVSKALTGQTATFAQGVLMAVPNYGLGAQTATFSQGTVIPAVSYGLSSLTATFSQGTLTPSTGGNVTIALNAQSATFTQGGLTPTVANALSGQSITSSEGTLSAQVSHGLTAQSAAFTEGSLAASWSGSAALSGMTATFTKGALLPTVTMGLAGETATFAQGALSHSLTIPLSAFVGTFSQGILTPQASGSVTIALASMTATFSQGILSPQTSGNVSLLMPNVICQEYFKAIQILSAAELNCDEATYINVSQGSPCTLSGHVVYQSIKEGVSVSLGQVVHLTVNKPQSYPSADLNPVIPWYYWQEFNK